MKADGESRTRTLLFSDIEGSTRLAAAAGDAYAGIKGTHHALIREAIAAQNGTEHSTAGDSFFVIFESARDALAAAVEAQLALNTHAWPEGLEVHVRMGLHSGEIGWADNDVVGLAIHEAARIMDAAHGGQVLVSPVVRELTVGASPTGVSLKSLGPHRLKDFDNPVELLQICHPDLPADFPPPRTRAVVVDLPAPRTSFVGREREVAEVLGLLAAGRHVTLTGVGGSGKTRLALEVAVLNIDRHPDGVFFVDLAPLADPDLVLSAVAAAAKAQGDPTDLEAMVLAYLSERQALIVLDNCEHLIDACADVVDLVLARCPAIRVLATSREALQIEGEQTFSVPSLAVDDETSAAVHLFVTRARAVKAAFTLTDANRDDVVAICRRLDGIPLAIELAAGRADHLSVSDIANRLDERFQLLVGGRRRRAQRQQTLQAAMDWSWDLLSDDERTLLRRLAVFAGPFSLTAAETVSGVRATLERLGSLLAKSLVTMEEDADTTRYRLLETVRLYAQERLVEAGEAAERRDAHRDWYLALTEGVPIDDLLVPRSVNRFFSDQPNLRAAMDWSAGQDRADLVARQLLRTSFAWSHSPALHDETRRSLLNVAEDEGLDAAVRADAFAALGFVSMMSGDLVAIPGFAERSLALDQSDREFFPLTLMWLGRYDESSEAAVASGQPVFARWCRAFVTGLWILIDPQSNLTKLEEIASELDPDHIGWDGWFTFVGIVVASLILDDPARAFEGVAEVQSFVRGYDEAYFGAGIQHADVLEAMVLGHMGRFGEARGVLLEATRAILREGYPLVSHDCLVVLAYITVCEGDHERAAGLLEPVARDGRLRMAPMVSFVAWFLSELHAKLAGIDVDPPLPTVGDFVTRVTARNGDPAAIASIEEKLIEFIG